MYTILDLIIALNKVLQRDGDLQVMAQHFETDALYDIMPFPTFLDEPEMAIHVWSENGTCFIGINDAKADA